MIIIGLLIGGTFGGMKLIDNMQVNRTVQDLKAIESAALTFKDTYGRLPGDIVNPAARLPNCTATPCATGGNGDRIIGLVSSLDDTMTATDENFVFWSHLSAADLISIGVKNTTDLSFGEGQPSAPIDGGYRLIEYTSTIGYCGAQVTRSSLLINSESTTDPTGPPGQMVSCDMVRAVDQKIDDGQIFTGVMFGGWGCEATPFVCNSAWAVGARGIGWYDIRGF